MELTRDFFQQSTKVLGVAELTRRIRGGSYRKPGLKPPTGMQGELL